MANSTTDILDNPGDGRRSPDSVDFFLVLLVFLLVRVAFLVCYAIYEVTVKWLYDRFGILERLQKPQEIFFEPPPPLQYRKRGPAPDDTYDIAALMNRRLPADLVTIVLDYAEHWLDVQLVSKEYEKIVDEETSGRPYMAYQFPSRFPRRGIRTLTFTIHSFSFDQPDEQGTDDDHWAWFEVNFIPSLQDEDFDWRKRYPSHGNRLKYTSKLEFKRRVKTVTWHFDSDDPYIRRTMRSLCAGGIIVLTGHANHPDWCYHIVAARMDCQYQGVRTIFQEENAANTTDMLDALGNWKYLFHDDWPVRFRVPRHRRQITNRDPYAPNVWHKYDRWAEDFDKVSYVWRKQYGWASDKRRTKRKEPQEEVATASVDHDGKTTNTEAQPST